MKKAIWVFLNTVFYFNILLFIVHLYYLVRSMYFYLYEEFNLKLPISTSKLLYYNSNLIAYLLSFGTAAIFYYKSKNKFWIVAGSILLIKFVFMINIMNLIYLKEILLVQIILFVGLKIIKQRQCFTISDIQK